MAPLVAVVDQDWIFLLEPLLQARRRFPHMRWVTTVVLVPRHKENRWIVLFLLNMVIWRVRVERIEVIFVLCSSILLAPMSRPVKTFVTNHVEQWSHTQDCAKQIRSLRHGRYHEKPRV